MIPEPLLSYCMLYCMHRRPMSPNICVARTLIRSLTWIPLCESKAMTCSSDLGLSVALRQEMGYLPGGVETSSQDRPETAA